MLFSILLQTTLTLAYAALETRDWNSQGFPLRNHGYFYTITVGLGDPQQEVELLLDTGSYQTWFPSTSNPHCSELRNERAISNLNSLNCETYGTYNETLSRTFNSTKEKFTTDYLDGTYVEGIVVHEDFRFLGSVSEDGTSNELELVGFEAGLGKNTNSSTGVLGLSLSSFKKSDENGVIYKRQSVIDQLKRNGQIDRRVFSIWLNKQDSSQGSILFGAVDNAKFTPPLKKVKMISGNYKDEKNYPAQNFETMITKVFVKTPERNQSHGYDLFNEIEDYQGSYISAIFDTGSYHTYFPADIYNKFLNRIGQYLHIQNDETLIECLTPDSDETFTIGIKFGTIVLEIPIRYLIEYADSSSFYVRHNNINYCKLNVRALDFGGIYNKIILGQGVLRSLYLVFDLDKYEISFAPSIFTSKSKIVDITSQNDIVGAKDGALDHKLLPDVYDPDTEFIQNTRENQFLKPLTSGFIKVGANWPLVVFVLIILYL
ncbi:hypothetical protein WICMUC_003504 [Wickerhamomyces mucosus]|uniref:Peptidase A1 domain-containing protein n=1 Tax=Wickerhamomyces mucosus TaxID=1378264 RepID=A0A9P8PK84_9ASCO|nr:hypothetical protein WICMUC_003504 [Wickerhamomyces mucosus]